MGLSGAYRSAAENVGVINGMDIQYESNNILSAINLCLKGQCGMQIRQKI